MGNHPQVAQLVQGDLIDMDMGHGHVDAYCRSFKPKTAREFWGITFVFIDFLVFL